MPEPIPDLAVALTTFNSDRTIDRVLESVRTLAANVVAVDSGSTDETVAICERHGATVIHQDWLGHVKQKQLAIDSCGTAEWILLLDSDESVQDDLADAIRTALSSGAPAADGFAINRKTWLLGAGLDHTFQPEWRVRLFRRTAGHIAGTPPHDRVDVDGRVDRLTGVLRHDSWIDLTDMLHRYVGYGKISAEDGRGGHLHNVLLSPGAAFLKQYLLKQGFRDGVRGLIAAGGAAAGTLIKHLYVAERRLRGTTGT